MRTTVLKLDSTAAFRASVETAAGALAKGAVIGLVTDTVYGLAADRDNAVAMRRLSELKQRPPGKPYTVLLARMDDLERFDVETSAAARRLCEAYWPGPLTVVIPSRSQGRLGFRVPAHAGAADIVRRSGVTIVAPSANPHGEKPALSAEEVLGYFDGRIECVVDGGRVVSGEASTVVGFEDERWEILREGSLSRPEVVKAVNFNVLFVCAGNTCRSPLAEAIYTALLAGRFGVGISEVQERGFSVESCGVRVCEGMSASEHSQELAREMGVDLSGHRSRGVSARLLARADRIYTMTRPQLDVVRACLPQAAVRARMLDEKADIGDPIGAGLEEYRRVAERMKKRLEAIVEEVAAK